MAVIKAFRGVRYGSQLTNEFGLLLAPPYDVLSPHLIERLRDRHANNMVHLEHIEPEPGQDPHQHAAKLYREWCEQGILIHDHVPSLYRYEHTFTANGQRLTRIGVLAAVRLAHWQRREVLPHEATFPQPRIERLKRLRAVQANLSPLYFLTRDPDHRFRELLNGVSDQFPVVNGIDPDGDEHRLSAITDPLVSAEIERVLADHQLYVADGHHRYEAALAYRDECLGQRCSGQPGLADGKTAAEYVLALICAANDPGVLVLPTHRLLFDLPNYEPTAIREKLAPFFDVEPIALDEPTDLAISDTLSCTTTICLMKFADEQQFWRIRRRADGAHETLMPNDHAPAWQELRVAVVGSALIEQLMGIAPDRTLQHVTYAHDVDTAMQALQSDSAQIACFLPASDVDELMAVADAGEIMPPKSTYFWPKVPAGLVIHDLT